ncbi:hypothetical protein ACFFK0_29385 [Paenibacillus chartarius]|uniref:Uncharacterized protein n=1 Tax=Paenibacillus chartarius TaxID=747481 RepID=A0ABV6DV53_9BACL
MEIVAVLPYTVNVELLLYEARARGFTSDTLMTIPLRNPDDAPKTIGAVGRGGRTNWDLGFVLGTIGMLVGSIYGFALFGGPVLWALFGLVTSFAAGVWLDNRLQKRQFKRRETKPSVVIWIRCEEQQKEAVRQWLAGHGAEGYGWIGE